MIELHAFTKRFRVSKPPRSENNLQGVKVVEENVRTYATMLKKAKKSLSRSESSLEDFTSRFNAL